MLVDKLINSDGVEVNLASSHYNIPRVRLEDSVRVDPGRIHRSDKFEYVMQKNDSILDWLLQSAEDTVLHWLVGTDSLIEWERDIEVILQGTADTQMILETDFSDTLETAETMDHFWKRGISPFVMVHEVGYMETVVSEVN